MKCAKRIYTDISIHAPRAGSDKAASVYEYGRKDFNPRSPCGERPYPAWRVLFQPAFQSTLPVRGATATFTTNPFAYSFQSTLPVRGATLSGMARTVPARISIHAPRAGSDSNILCFCKLKAQYILNQLF